MRKMLLGSLAALAWVSAARAELITNGTFNTDISGWTFNKTGESISDSINALAVANNPANPAGYWTAGSKVARLQIDKSPADGYTACTDYAFQRVLIPATGDYQLTGKIGTDITKPVTGWAGAFFFKDMSAGGTAAEIEAQIDGFLPAALSPTYGSGTYPVPSSHSVNLYEGHPEIVVEANQNTTIDQLAGNTFAQYAADSADYHGIADLTSRQTKSAVAGEYWVVGFFALNSDANTSARESYFFDDISLVPEPTAMMLLCLAVLPLLRRRR